jgi:hypothetical protein
MPADCWLIWIGPSRTREQRWPGPRLRTEHDHEQALEEYAAQERADEHGGGRPPHQWEIGDEREREPDEEHDDDDSHENERPGRDDRLEGDRRIAARHYQLALREVHRARRIDHEHEAERHQCV